ncbi:MAG: FlgB family protein [Alphaproteobacteria bacterium]
MKFDIGILNMAQGLAAHASARQTVISENIANADTPDYKARDTATFAETYKDSVRVRNERPAREGHLPLNIPNSAAQISEDAAFAAESPNGNTVSLEDQMVRAADVRYQHDLALGIYGKSIDILRAGMGRIR